MEVHKCLFILDFVIITGDQSTCTVSTKTVNLKETENLRLNAIGIMHCYITLVQLRNLPENNDINL